MSNRRKPKDLNWADRRALRTRVRERALATFLADQHMEGEDVEQLPGFTMWTLGPAKVVMPTLLEGAPQEVTRAYVGRIVANATGECPECGEITEDRREGVVGSELSHFDDCTVYRLEVISEGWLDPRAEAMMRGEEF